MAFAVQIKEVSGDKNKNSKKINMSGISLNQMYKQSGAADNGVSYKDWIASEESLYKAKIENGKIQGQMPFNFWMENRWKGKMLSAEGKLAGVLSGLKGIGKDVLNKTILNKQAGTSSGASESTSAGSTAGGGYVEPPKRILGMKPVIFWALTGVTLIGATFVTIKVIQKIRKS